MKPGPVLPYSVPGTAASFGPAQSATRESMPMATKNGSAKSRAKRSSSWFIPHSRRQDNACFSGSKRCSPFSISIWHISFWHWVEAKQGCGQSVSASHKGGGAAPIRVGVQAACLGAGAVGAIAGRGMGRMGRSYEFLPGRMRAFCATTVAPEGTSSVTVALAPTVTSSPILTGPRMVAPAPA